MNVEALSSKILQGNHLTYDEAVTLFDCDVDTILKQSKRIKEKFHQPIFDLCTIINGKSGLCSEDCMYCAQSSYYACDIQEYRLLDKEIIVKDALINEKRGIGKFSIVTSGKRVCQDELERLCDTYREISRKSSINLCASHGLLTYDDFLKLKASGVKRIHNNLETSRAYFEKICTTHTYDEKIETIKAAQRAGLEVCSGGIIGMGETVHDRISLAFELKGLGIQSVPLNMLNPIEGTPIHFLKPISESEFYKTCAIFRMILPQAVIRLAGGRGLLSDRGKLAFETCVNGCITGELLTTTGNGTKKDIEIIRGIGYEI